MNKYTIELLKNNLSVVLPQTNNVPDEIKLTTHPIMRIYTCIEYQLLSIVIEISMLISKISLDNLKYFTKFDTIKGFDRRGANVFDYGFNNKLIRHEITAKSGSSTSNNTYIFCHDIITADILTSLLCKKKRDNNIIINFPTVTSVAVMQLIYIYTYICTKVTICKNDDWLKDSFYMIGENINYERLEIVKSKLNGNINRTMSLDCIFSTFMIPNNSFLNIYRGFIISISTCIYDLWNNIIKSIDKSPTDRDLQFWKDYDTLVLS